MSITTLTWAAPAPAEAGGAPGSVRFDLLRSLVVSDFDAAGGCVASGVVEAEAEDGTMPVDGAVLFYLSRATNACLGGVGTLGRSSAGEERAGRGCM